MILMPTAAIAKPIAAKKKHQTNTFINKVVELIII